MDNNRTLEMYVNETEVEEADNSCSKILSENKLKMNQLKEENGRRICRAPSTEHHAYATTVNFEGTKERKLQNISHQTTIILYFFPFFASIFRV